MDCESKNMHQTEVWRLNEAWKESGKVHIRVCTKLMDILNCSANGFAKMELGSQ
jgi:peroxiredoxin family protein